MTWRASHPGGVAVCDADGCERQRRIYCSPAEFEEWAIVVVGSFARDYCPRHRPMAPDPVNGGASDV